MSVHAASQQCLLRRLCVEVAVLLELFDLLGVDLVAFDDINVAHNKELPEVALEVLRGVHLLDHLLVAVEDTFDVLLGVSCTDVASSTFIVQQLFQFLRTLFHENLPKPVGLLQLLLHVCDDALRSVLLSVEYFDCCLKLTFIGFEHPIARVC